MKSEVFQRRWFAAFPEVEPHGQSLRSALSDRWLRVHSLPESKRYPETAGERAEVVRRHLAVLRHAFGSRPLRALFNVWKAGEGAARFGFAQTEAWTVPAGRWLDVPRSVEITDAFAAEDVRLPNVVLAVADDETDGVLLVADELDTLVALYDGGADLFLADAAGREEARAQFAAWTSSRPDGL